MKSNVKKLWLQALRSGKYEQTQGTLRDTENGFCCLGVLCNLHAQTHPKIAAREKHSTAYMGHSGDLPHSVMQWAGLEDSDPLVVYRGEADTLAGLNDSVGLSFKKIANVIEKQL